MQILASDWQEYIDMLAKINQKAVEEMQAFVEINGLEDRKKIIDFAYSIITKYGEAGSELACQMYDAIVELEIASDMAIMFGEAVPASTPTYAEVAKAINGSMKQSPSGQLLEGVIVRQIKMCSADTMLYNGLRDGAQFAWIPHGDTCAFCLTLASRGWQNISEKALKKGHAEHIHGNCDCTYAIRHDHFTDVEGYDPYALEKMYYEASDGSPKDKINAMRRKQYQLNRNDILEQKRRAYAIRKGNEVE